MKKIVILSGAGISAESGIKTFRDTDGLWEGHDVMQVASPEGFEKDPALVLDFYNQRRKQLLEVEPNEAHKIIADLQNQYDVTVVTQNIDDLHERAGSKKIIHLHGELLKSRSSQYPHLIYPIKKDILLGDVCEKGSQLRPFIVWFGEEVPLLQNASIEVYDADIVIIVGTSMKVYPAAGLIQFAKPDSKIFYIDLNPAESGELTNLKNLTIIKDLASKGMKKVVELL
jgi:NAD-dependent deacetylase